MKTIKLLLADDHQIVLDGLQALLEKDPEMQILGAATSGEKALELLKQEPADVVVLDISMPPGMDGIETARHILRDYPRTKIILLTMIGEGRFILNAMQMGIHGYILKEKSKEALVAAIRSVHGGSRYYSPDLIAVIPQGMTKQEDQKKISTLTDREIVILCMLAENPGFTAKEVGNQLFINEVTVNTHIRNIKAKLDMHTRAELVVFAREQRLCGEK